MSYPLLFIQCVCGSVKDMGDGMVIVATVKEWCSWMGLWLSLGFNGGRGREGKEGRSDKKRWVSVVV